MAKVNKTDKQWRQELSEEAYEVTRKKGTERAFTGKYDKFYEEGVYHCICCKAELFKSEDKFDSGSGWPSFTKPAAPTNVDEHLDYSLAGRARREIVCHNCDAHLGHVFEDGPKELTGLRYCINSCALEFKERNL